MAKYFIYILLNFVIIYCTYVENMLLILKLFTVPLYDIIEVDVIYITCHTYISSDEKIFYVCIFKKYY